MPPQHVTPEWVAAQSTAAHGGQVGGHPGSLQSLVGPNGEHLVVKESLASEAAFYEDLYEEGLLPGESEAAAEHRKELRERWAPTYHGSLPPSSSSETSKGRIIISDLLAGFKRPCMMDVKLGSQLWDESATEEKRIRMDKASKDSTSWTTGLRVTGWRVWDPQGENYVTYTKAWGRKAQLYDLPQAFFSFLAGFDPKELAAFDEILESYGETDEVRQQHQALDYYSANFQQMLDSLVKDYFLPQVQRLRTLLASLEMRIRGGSVLLIYEGDERELTRRMDAYSDSADAETKGSTPRPPAPAAVHFIDFAHATFRHAEHAGPDDGVVMGLDMLIHLLHGRLDYDWAFSNIDWLPTRGAEAAPTGPGPEAGGVKP